MEMETAKKNKSGKKIMTQNAEKKIMKRIHANKIINKSWEISWKTNKETNSKKTKKSWKIKHDKTSVRPNAEQIY